jgi:hypothetical protein
MVLRARVLRAARWSSARRARRSGVSRSPTSPPVHTMAPVVIPGDAYLLVEGDRPRDPVNSILISLVLITFGVFKHRRPDSQPVGR